MSVNHLTLHHERLVMVTCRSKEGQIINFQQQTGIDFEMLQFDGLFK